MVRYKLFVKVLLFTYVLYAFAIGGGKCDAMKDKRVSLMYNNIVKVEVDAGGPSYLEHQKYDYMTSSANEIIYILHYINSFNLKDDGKILYAYDVSSYSVKFYLTDGNIKSCGFSIGRFYDESGKQYGIDANEYNRFLEFIHGLKTNKIVLDEATFNPNEWAEEYVEIAIANDLLPEWFRINYDKNITRIEFCQLVDNFLSVTGTQLDSEELVSPPFSDVADKGVTFLWNKGIVNGKSETEFCPYDYITREEAAKILSGLCDVAGIEKNGTEIDYADKDEISDWAVDYVEDMTTIGVFTGDNENKFNPQDNITKEELIVILVRLNDKL